MVVVVIIILAAYYFIWVNPVYEVEEEVTASFDITPIQEYYFPGTVITLDAAKSKGDGLKYLWEIDDDFKIINGHLRSKSLNGYFVGTENIPKQKSIVLTTTKNDVKDTTTRTISLQPKMFEVSEEKIGDYGEFKVEGFLDISNPDGLVKIHNDEYNADITVNSVNVQFHTTDSKPMTSELKTASDVRDGFRQKHTVYERVINQDLVLSGIVSVIANIENPPFGIGGDGIPLYPELEGTMKSEDWSYTD